MRAVRTPGGSQGLRASGPSDVRSCRSAGMSQRPQTSRSTDLAHSKRSLDAGNSRRRTWYLSRANPRQRTFTTSRREPCRMIRSQTAKSSALGMSVPALPWVHSRPPRGPAAIEYWRPWARNSFQTTFPARAHPSPSCSTTRLSQSRPAQRPLLPRSARAELRRS